MYFKSRETAEVSRASVEAPAARLQSEGAAVPEAATDRPVVENKNPAEGVADEADQANSNDRGLVADERLPLSPEEIRRGAVVSKHRQASFGQIVSLMMRHPEFRSVPISELEVLVWPAIGTGQFLIGEAQSKSRGFMSPVAAVLWATVSEDLDRRFEGAPDQHIRLAPKDWKSGDIPWLVMTLGDQRIVKGLMDKLCETGLQGRAIKLRAKDKNGKATVITLGPK